MDVVTATACASCCTCQGTFVVKSTDAYTRVEAMISVIPAHNLLYQLGAGHSLAS